MRQSAQLSLLDLVPTPQPRRQMRESDRLYDTVMGLRRYGVPVHAEGQHHRVGHALMTTTEMLAYAKILRVAP